MKEEITYALVTGAGKGLGKEIARELARMGRNLLLVAMEGEGLIEYGEKLQHDYRVVTHCLEVDFLSSAAMGEISDWINGYKLDMLVNNAGVGGSTFFDMCDLRKIDAIIQINIRALALLTRIVLPKLKANRRGYILNIASMASFCPIAYKTVYPASKSFVYSFSRSLSVELRDDNINVAVLSPGPIKTNFEVISRIEKQGWWIKAGLLSPERIARTAVKQMLEGRMVIIPGFINKINWFVLKVLPQNICIHLISKAVKNEIVQLQPAM